MKRLLFISLLAALIIAGCGAPALQSEKGAPRGQSFGLRNMSVPEVAPAEAPSAASDSEAGLRAVTSGNAGDEAAIQRLVIQNAELSIVVKDVEARMRAVESLATKLGGYVVSSNKYQTYDRSSNLIPQADVVIRVPAGRLDEALEAIKKDVVEVSSESRSGQDVTAEYVDLQSQLKNLEATEAQLQKIMESTTQADDALNVFNRLTEIRGQIEQVKGQIKYYEESAALSAVSVHILAEATLQPIEIGGWKPQGVARDAIQDLVYFFQGFINFLIRVVLLILPALVLIAIPVYLVFLGIRALLRKFRKPKIKPEPEATEQK